MTIEGSTLSGRWTFEPGARQPRARGRAAIRFPCPDGRRVVTVMPYGLVEVKSDADWHSFHDLRRSVLWDARGRHGYRDDHPDDRRASNHPLLFKLDDVPIGTTRLDEWGDHRGVVRLVAIAAGMQRRGHGRALSDAIEGYARRSKIATLLVNAAPDAVGFYLKTGWHRFVWDEAELTGFASNCTQMRKALAP